MCVTLIGLVAGCNHVEGAGAEVGGHQGQVEEDLEVGSAVEVHGLVVLRGPRLPLGQRADRQRQHVHHHTKLQHTKTSNQNYKLLTIWVSKYFFESQNKINISENCRL